MAPETVHVSPGQDMNPHAGQKDWIGGGYLNSGYAGYGFRHADLHTKTRRT